MLHSNPDTNHWYRVSTHEIMKNHNIAIHNDGSFKIVQLPLAELNDANAIETFARLSNTNSQTYKDQPSNGQHTTNSHNSNEYNTSSKSILLSDNQSNIILHQYH